MNKSFSKDYLRGFDYEGFAQDMYTSVGVIPREVSWFELPLEERVQWTNAAKSALVHIVDEAYRDGFSDGGDEGYEAGYAEGGAAESA